MESVSERRTAVRVLHEVPIWFRSQSTFYTGLQRDISTGGVFIATDDLLPRGTRVRFELTLGPQVIRVPVEGTVRWVRAESDGGMSAGIGVQWDELSPRLLSKIESFLEKRDSLYFDDEG